MMVAETNPVSPKDSKDISTELIKEDDMEEERAVFESLFSTRRPKDGWAGLSSGLKSVLKGTGAGMAALIAAPAAGLHQEGAIGFVKGLGVGVASAVALPVTGLVVGAYQAGRGIYNSAEAVTSSSTKIWDTETREWKYYRLDDDAEKIKAQLEELKNSEKGEVHYQSRKVKDTTYYDLLKVDTSADAAALKRAYYKEARNCHPDKNPGDKNAAVKFQRLQTAYQTLANDDTRAAYDNNGISEDGRPSNTMMDLTEMDPRIFFAVMFGSDAVRSYVGDLWIAGKVDSLMKSAKITRAMSADQDSDDTDETIEAFRKSSDRRSKYDKLKQEQREVEIAIFLRDKIATRADEAEWVAGLQEEAANITKGAFGDVFCRTIGYALLLEAEEFVASYETNVLKSAATAFKKRGYQMQNQFKVFGSLTAAASAGTKAYKHVDRLQKKAAAAKLQNDGDKVDGTIDSDSDMTMDPESVKAATEQIEASLPAFLEFAWALNVQDITKTLQGVCRKLLYDDAETISMEQRVDRARALMSIGREFWSIGEAAASTNIHTGKTSAGDIKARAEVAAMTTFAKAQGQEINEKDAEELIKQAKRMS